MDEAEKWERRYRREKVARKEAERLLEEKSLALYLKTRELDEMIDRQKEEIADRTRDLRIALEEARMLSDAVSHTENGVIITGPDNRVMWANAAIERISGYSRETFLGKSPGEVLQGPETAQGTRQYMREQIRARRAFEAEVLNYSRDGAPYWVRINATPVFDRDGTFRYFVAIQSDITEARANKQKLEHETNRAREMAERAREASAAKTKFLATMSHELRTPLNGIIGYAQILLTNRSLDERTRAQVAIMRRSGEHLLSLINEILDISKIESGSFQLSTSRFALEELLDGVLQILEPKAVEKGLTLVRDFPELSRDPGEPRIFLTTDPRALRQVLINLLGNSIKFTVRGSVSLEVAVDWEGMDQARVRFAIADTGRGIPPEARGRIFEPFQQVDADHDMISGSGLGLNIAQRLVQQMGGEIRVESTVGQGSRFSFEILCDAELAVEEVPSGSAGLGMPQGYNGPRKRILVVDDIRDNRTFLIDLLSPLGFLLAAAENGREALRKLRAGQYDLVLSDIIMPLMNGEELVRIVRADPELAATRIIAVSASVPGEQAREYADFDGFVAKPIQAEALFGLLGRELGIDWIYPSDSPSGAQLVPAQEGGLVRPASPKADHQTGATDASAIFDPSDRAVGAILHAMRNSIAAVSGFAEEFILDFEEAGSPREWLEAVRHLGRSAREMARAMESLVVLRSLARTGPGEAVRFEWADCFAGIVERYRAQVDVPELELATEFGVAEGWGNPPLVEELLFMIVRNVANLLLQSDHGLRLKVATQARPGETVRLSLEANTRELGEEERERLLAPIGPGGPRWVRGVDVLVVAIQRIIDCIGIRTRVESIDQGTRILLDLALPKTGGPVALEECHEKSSGS